MFRSLRNLTLLVVAPLLLAGCVLSQNITPDQQATHALVISAISKDAHGACASPGNPLDCLYLGYVDDKASGLAAPQLLVLPGHHVISTVWSHGVIQTLPSAPLVFPTFDYQAGHRYVLVPGGIYDTAWNDPAHPIVVTYVVRDGHFMNQQIVSAMDRASAEAAESAFRIQQQRDRPRIMKKGAEVCLHGGSGIGNHGFVEGATDEKIEIHLSSWQGNDRDIWDFPTQWFLCGHN